MYFWVSIKLMPKQMVSVWHGSKEMCRHKGEEFYILCSCCVWLRGISFSERSAMRVIQFMHRVVGGRWMQSTTRTRREEDVGWMGRCLFCWVGCSLGFRVCLCWWRRVQCPRHSFVIARCCTFPIVLNYYYYYYCIPFPHLLAKRG